MLMGQSRKSDSESAWQARKSEQRTGWRLRLLRGAYGARGIATTQKEFASYLGIPPKSYNGYEKGHPIKTLNALKIQDKLGVSIAWLHTGDKHHLSFEARTRIERAELALASRGTC